MSFIGFLELISLLSYLFILILLISRWKSSFSYVIKRILLILIIFFIFHSFSNTLEWLYITDVLDTYEDYIEIAEPILLWIFFATFIQEMSEKNRRESERKYRHLFETSPYFIGLMDINGVLIDSNNVINKFLSIHTKEDIIGRKITEIFSLNEKNKYLIPIFENVIKNIFEGIGTYQKPFDFQLYQSSGGYLWLHVEGTLIEIEEQKFTQFIIQDITERKLAEKKIKDSEEKYRYLFDNAQVGLYWSRISDGKFLECNDTFAKLFGYDTREDFLANYNAIEHYIDPNARSEIIEEIRDTKVAKNYEIHVTRRDGTPIWLSLSTRMFEKEDRFEGAAIDITERKKVEEKLIDSEEKSRYLIDGITSVGIGIDIVNKDYKVLFQNQVLKEKFGDITGKICYEEYMGLKAPCDYCPMIKALKNNTIESTELIGVDGINYELFSAPYLDSDRTTEKVIEIVMNISERKQAEMALRESEKKYREAYDRAEFYKDIFTHDINNILQIILSGTQVSELIFDNPEKIDELKLNAETIKEQIIRGAKLVSNVRILSNLEEAGRSLEKIEIVNVLKNTVSFVKKSYKDKNLTIRVDFIRENLFIKANNLLEDVFENILINAIRHNRNLKIDINVRVSRERKEGISYLKMEFLDNGFGVGDSMKNKIFQRGYSKEKSVYGMGLGLSLVRRIIENYDGKIWVEDRVKGDRTKGSNFVLLIPEVD